MKIKISRFSVLIRFISYLFFHAIGLTNRLAPLHIDYRNYFQERGQKVIIATWHSQIFLSVYHLSKFGFSVIISQSDDGEIAAQAVQSMGISVIRGSASRNGARALLGLVREIKKGSHIAITPDGPRGPKEQVLMGVITLAKLSGHSILPQALDCTRKIRLHSWDELIVPLPFGAIVYDFGELISVPHDADEDLMEQKRLELETVLQTLTANVNRYVKEAL